MPAPASRRRPAGCETPCADDYAKQSQSGASRPWDCGLNDGYRQWQTMAVARNKAESGRYGASGETETSRVVVPAESKARKTKPILGLKTRAGRPRHETPCGVTTSGEARSTARKQSQFPGRLAGAGSANLSNKANSQGGKWAVTAGRKGGYDGTHGSCGCENKANLAGSFVVCPQGHDKKRLAASLRARGPARETKPICRAGGSLLGWGRYLQAAEAVAAVGVGGGEGQGDLRRAGGRADGDVDLVLAGLEKAGTLVGG